MTKHVREITAISSSRPTMEGAGVHLHRAFGFQNPERHDPFLLLDDFRSDQPEDYLAGFPWHPHRGIETITYMLDGHVEHGDSMGNSGKVQAGEVQWMTAGRGIIHQEMPKPDQNGHMGGFQLWTNLPAAKKMITPRYQEFTHSDFPRAKLEGGASAAVICGECGPARGPVVDVEIAPSFFDVTVPAAACTRLTTQPDHTVLAYVFAGSGYFDEKHNPAGWEVRQDGYTEQLTDARLGNRKLIYFGPGHEIKVTAAAGDQDLRFLLIMGKPLKEPIAWRGPIVMNTREELNTAFKELDDGTFTNTS